MRYAWVVIIGAIACGGGGGAPSTTAPSRARYVLEFADKAGETESDLQGGPFPIDLIRILMTFDVTTGDYTITLTTVDAKPFRGSCRVNVNLYNPAVTEAQSFFTSRVNDFNLAAPSTSLEIRGNDSKLTAWALGQQVAADDLAGLGFPPGLRGFGSGVCALPTDRFNQCDSTLGAIATIRPSG